MDPKSDHLTLELSALDQILPGYYARMVLCFSRPLDSDQSATVATLQKALAATVTAVPFLAGQVCPALDGEGSRGRLEVRYREDGMIPLHVKDVSKVMRTFAELEQAEMPMSMMDSDLLAPLGVIVPGNPRTAVTDGSQPSTPVVAVQANFVTGGLILVVCVHHATMDGTGLGNLIDLLALHCRSSTAPGPLPASVWDRRSLAVDGHPPVSPERHPEYKIEPAASTPTAPVPAAPPSLPPITSRIFHLSLAKLARLKRDASPADGSSWISTNDGLAALIWHCLSRARAGHLSPEQKAAPSMLGIAVNGRARMQPALAEPYLGNVNLFAHVTAPVLDLIAPSNPLSTSAVAIRKAIAAIDDPHIRSAIALIQSIDDLSRLQPGFQPFLTTDIAMSSWTHMPVYQADFGAQVGGRPRWIRLPQSLFDGLAILLPRRPSTTTAPAKAAAGKDVNEDKDKDEDDDEDKDRTGFDLFISLRADDMASLVQDEQWRKYAGEGVA
ncbi:MAG: hypothetical protein M1826_005075 [Phylliscum demangeonii]|nr:MAG: hypothetical protein M1826_005075 [Phylliscum demangeonii]